MLKGGGNKALLSRKIKRPCLLSVLETWNLWKNVFPRSFGDCEWFIVYSCSYHSRQLVATFLKDDSETLINTAWDRQPALEFVHSWSDKEDHSWTERIRQMLLIGWTERKGFFAIVCQAFCDAYTMLQIFDVMWPGATNDVVGYRQSNLFTMVAEGKIPSWCHFVLNEAYSACGGIHLTPWSKEQLRAATDISEVEYQKRLAFILFHPPSVSLSKEFWNIGWSGDEEYCRGR